MYTDAIHHRSIQAWLAVAMFAPLAHYSGGSWPALLVMVLLSVGLIGLLPEDPVSFQRSRLLCFIELVWLYILASHYLSLSASYWPGEKSQWAVPTVLLLLGAYSCKGRPARTAGVLFWLLILMLIPFALAVVKDAEAKWLLPQQLQCSGWAMPALLLPAAAAWLPATGKKCNFGWISYFFAIGVWMATSTVLSPNVAQALETPFRDLSRSLTLGAGSRFESLAGVMITLGWFALASLLLKLSTLILEALGLKENLAPWAAVAPVIVLCWLNVQPDPLFSAIMTLVLWVFVPMLHCKKISKKSEKSA